MGACGFEAGELVDSGPIYMVAHLDAFSQWAVGGISLGNPDSRKLRMNPQQTPP